LFRHADVKADFAPRRFGRRWRRIQDVHHALQHFDNGGFMFVEPRGQFLFQRSQLLRQFLGPETGCSVLVVGPAMRGGFSHKRRKPGRSACDVQSERCGCHRTLNNPIGRDLEDGLIPNNEKLVGGIIRNFCYANAKNYMAFPGVG
jgi:hypothetical protein